MQVRKNSFAMAMCLTTTSTGTATSRRQAGEPAAEQPAIIKFLTHSPKSGGFFVLERRREDMRSSSENGYGWRVVVPATSANLGCAFDCGGLALKLYLKALFVPSDGNELSLEYQGKTPDRFPMKSSNLILHSLRYAAEKLGTPAPGGHVVVQSDIPIGVGLGSSAASVIAGLLLGARYSGEDAAAEQILRWAEEIEGHVDNAA